MKRYEINPMKKSTIKKINLLKDFLKITTTGLLIEHLVKYFIKDHKEKIKDHLNKIL